MAKGCALSTGYLPRGGLPRNSVDRITDRPDMTSAVDRGRKASTQTNKQTNKAAQGRNQWVKCLKFMVRHPIDINDVCKHLSVLNTTSGYMFKVLNVCLS